MLWKRILNDARGQALVELALALTLLMLVILSMVEFGRIGHTYLMAVHASREGARMGSLRYSDDRIFERVDHALASLGDIPVQVSVHPNDSARQRKDHVEVVVSIQLPLITPMGAVFPDPFMVQGRTVMRVE